MEPLISTPSSQIPAAPPSDKKVKHHQDVLTIQGFAAAEKAISKDVKSMAKRIKHLEHLAAKQPDEVQQKLQQALGKVESAKRELAFGRDQFHTTARHLDKGGSESVETNKAKLNETIASVLKKAQEAHIEALSLPIDQKDLTPNRVAKIKSAMVGIDDTMKKLNETSKKTGTITQAYVDRMSLSWAGTVKHIVRKNLTGLSATATLAFYEARAQCAKARSAVNAALDGFKHNPKTYVAEQLLFTAQKAIVAAQRAVDTAREVIMGIINQLNTFINHPKDYMVNVCRLGNSKFKKNIGIPVVNWTVGKIRKTRFKCWEMLTKLRGVEKTYKEAELHDILHGQLDRALETGKTRFEGDKFVYAEDPKKREVRPDELKQFLAKRDATRRAYLEKHSKVPTPPKKVKMEQTGPAVPTDDHPLK